MNGAYVLRLCCEESKYLTMLMAFSEIPKIKEDEYASGAWHWRAMTKNDLFRMEGRQYAYDE